MKNYNQKLLINLYGEGKTDTLAEPMPDNLQDKLINIKERITNCESDLDYIVNKIIED